MKKENVIIIGLLLLVIVLGSIAFIVLKDEEPKINNTTSLDINSSLVKDLYEMVNFSNDAIILNDLYKNDNLSDTYKIAMGITSYLNDNQPIEVTNSNDLLSYIPAIDIDKKIKLVLGDITYQKQDAYIMNRDYCIFFYNEELDRYEYKGGCGGNQFERYYRKIIDAYKKEDKLYIKEKMFYLYNDWDDYISKKTIYTNPDKETILDYMETDSSGTYELDVEKYIDKGSIYEYEYQQIDNNNNYIFLGIKRIS